MSSRGKKQRAEESRAKQSSVAEGKRPVINKWDTAAVKNALDDTAKKIMVDDLECVEDFTIIDRRLLLCTVACGFSVFALAYDYLIPFPLSGTILTVCAISYFMLMGVLSLYSLLVEDSIFMLARQRNPKGVGPDVVWTLSSSLPRFSHNYSFTIHCSGGGQTANSTGTSTIKESVTRWFDEDGTLAFNEFHSDIMQCCNDALKSGKAQ